MEITELLHKARQGDEEAHSLLIPVVYQELKRLAASHLRGQSNSTLSPTALVHEAYLRLADLRTSHFEHRAQFFGIASRLMRNVLVDMIRHSAAQKRGGGQMTIQLVDSLEIPTTSSNDTLALDEALTKLASDHPRQADAIELKYFGGLTFSEIANVLQVSEATVQRDLRFGQAWLHRQLSNQR